MMIRSLRLPGLHLVDVIIGMDDLDPRGEPRAAAWLAERDGQWKTWR
jgi:hypothetical protein